MEGEGRGADVEEYDESVGEGSVDMVDGYLNCGGRCLVERMFLIVV